MSREPTGTDFSAWCAINHTVRLSNAQLELADALIDYRRKHFMMGLRAGRTTVVDLVQAYFENCGWPRAGKEI